MSATPVELAQQHASEPREDALARIQGLVERFGWGHFDLACHLAAPISLTPDLAYQLWFAFGLPNVPWTAVSDILLSSLCRDHGWERYQLYPETRRLLLAQLRHSYETSGADKDRMQRVSQLLLSYADAQARLGTRLDVWQAEGEQINAIALVDVGRADAQRNWVQQRRLQQVRQQEADIGAATLSLLDLHHAVPQLAQQDALAHGVPSELRAVALGQPGADQARDTDVIEVLNFELALARDEGNAPERTPTELTYRVSFGGASFEDRASLQTAFSLPKGQLLARVWGRNGRAAAQKSAYAEADAWRSGDDDLQAAVLAAILFPEPVRNMLKAALDGLGPHQRLRLRLDLSRTSEARWITWEQAAHPFAPGGRLALDARVSFVRRESGGERFDQPPVETVSLVYAAFSPEPDGQQERIQQALSDAPQFDLRMNSRDNAGPNDPSTSMRVAHLADAQAGQISQVDDVLRQLRDRVQMPDHGLDLAVLAYPGALQRVLESQAFNTDQANQYAKVQGHVAMAVGFVEDALPQSQQVFCSTFYTALANGVPADLAAADARRALHRQNLDWCTLVCLDMTISGDVVFAPRNFAAERAASNTATAKANAPPREPVHTIYLGANGLLAGRGQSPASTPGEISELLQDFLDTSASWPTRRLMMYSHGPFVSRDHAAQYAQRIRDRYLEQQIYPVFVIWPTDVLGSMTSMLTGKRDPAANVATRKGDRFARSSDSSIDAAVETVGSATTLPLWLQMKSVAVNASRHAEGGMRVLADALAAMQAEVELHLVGHSIGCELLGALAALLQERKRNPASLTVWAPTMRMDAFEQQLLPQIRDNPIQRFGLFTLDDPLERKDKIAGVYRKSLLYFASHALEPLPEAATNPTQGTPILGMSKFIDVALPLITLLEQNPERCVWIEADATSMFSQATTHASFDDDDATIRATIRIMRGEALPSETLGRSAARRLLKRPAAKGPPPDPVSLRNRLTQQFSIDEIKALCLDLGVDFENLGGDTKLAIALNLVSYMDRRERLPELAAAIDTNRPRSAA